MGTSSSISKREKDIRTQISVLTGELNGIIKSRKLLERLAREWGLDEVPATDVDNNVVPEASGGVDDPELKRLVSEGKCKYRDKDTKKWCQRILKTKKEKVAKEIKTLEEKSKQVNEKIKKGKKLTTEDLLVFQRTMSEDNQKEEQSEKKETKEKLKKEKEVKEKKKKPKKSTKKKVSKKKTKKKKTKKKETKKTAEKTNSKKDIDKPKEEQMLLE